MQRFIPASLIVVCVWCLIVDAPDPAEGSTIGGAVYTDIGDPLTSGLVGVEVCVACFGGFSACDVTEGSWGGWDVSGVPDGSCTVTLNAEGWCFSHVVQGVIGEPAPITITVDEDHLEENLSIQFLGTEGAMFCCVVAEDCDDGEACTVDECFDGVCVSTPNDCPADFDCDGFVGAPDLAVLLGNWGPCPECEADLNDDGVVGPFDLAFLLGSWGPCL